MYKVKCGANGQVDKLKARYVAKGYAQIAALDFFDTYASSYLQTRNFSNSTAIAAQKDLHLRQMDVKSAYLHSKIEEEPAATRFFKKANSGQKLVCKMEQINLWFETSCKKLA